MALHHAAQFALCVTEPNPSQPNVACLPLVMKDDLHAGHHHHHQNHLAEYDRMSKITTNGKSAWTDAATDCLIDVFQEKWNSLRRGNLKAKNWDEVGMELGHRCGVPKTGDQCRHKIEKLRGRFRQEKVVSNFGQSKWPWYERLNMVFGDRVRQLRDGAAEYDSADKSSAVDMRNQEGFPQQGHAIDEGVTLAASQHQQQHHHQLHQLHQQHQHQQHQQHQHELMEGRVHIAGDAAAATGGVEDKNDKGDASYTSHSQKPANNNNNNSTDRDDGGSPRSKACRSSRKRSRREWSELGAAMKYLGESLLKIEECKLELQRDNERLRLEMEARRAQMQDVELKRTEMLIQMELKRTEMLCELEVKRTQMQMDLFETLANRASARPKRST